MAGRPEEITMNEGTEFQPHILEKLEKSFLEGLNNTEACLLANISEDIYYLVLRNNQKLKERFELLKNNTKLLAKQNIHKEINAGDKEISKWYLERRDKEFKPKSDIMSDDKAIPTPIIKLESNDIRRDDSNQEDTSVE